MMLLTGRLWSSEVKLKDLRESGVGSIGVPYGNRTRVAAVKGRCPRPLDERDADGGWIAL